jgi:hypothetical protein
MKPADSGHEIHGHVAVLGGAAEIHAPASVEHDLRGIEAGVLVLGHEPLTHEVALPARLDRHAGGVEGLQHLEVVADVVTVIVGEEHQHGLG